jgi:tetratricopeptide (TPR) repeat protein
MQQEKHKSRFGTLLGVSLLFLLAFPLGQGVALADVETSLRLAGRALAAGDLATAENTFRQAAERHPDNALAWLGLAAAEEGQAEFMAALKHVRQAVALAPDQFSSALALGRIMARLGASEGALVALAAASSLEPEDPRAYLISALLLRDLGRTGEAVELLTTALRRGVKDAEIRVQLGLLLLANEQPGAAWDVVRVALKEHPEHPASILLAGLSLAQLPERRKDALGYLRRVVEKGDGPLGRAHLALGGLLFSQEERRQESLQHFRLAVAQLPRLPEAHYRLGTALRAVGDLEGARASLERFRQLSGVQDSADASAKELGISLNRIQDLASAGRLEEALDDLEGLLERHPKAAQILALKAKVLYSMGRPAAALQQIIKAREEAPDKVEYHYLEGVFWAQLERSRKAEAAFGRALALDPGLAEAEAFLGALISDQGRHEEALLHYENALELGAEGVALHLGYARALEQLGRREESEAQLQAAQRRGSQ